jgi:hypothetical protein
MNTVKWKLMYAVVAIILVLPVTPEADERSGDVMLVDAVNATATVVNVDAADRSITLRKEDGGELSIIAGEEVRNFAQIRKGDIVEVKYYRAAASALEKVEDLNIASESSEVRRTPKGAKPGMSMQHSSTIVAEVLGVDKDQRLLTVRGPQGGIVTVAVPVDMKAFDTLKVGDRISAVYTQALAISVTSPTK